MEPVLGKYPAEVFAYPYSRTDNEATAARANQYCRFLQGECKKPRKSEPHVKVGVCSVGYKGSFLETYRPVIVCPHRFDPMVIFQFVEGEFFASLSVDEHIEWAREVSLSALGSIDYVGARLQKTGGRLVIRDLLCLEIQAAGTTGTPWAAVQELLQSGRYKRGSYNFGINWANEFAKTMMQQAYKKGMITESWGKKLVFAVQDIGFHYLQHAYDTGGLHQADAQDTIFFCTFQLVWDKHSWTMRPAEVWGTNTEGVRRMLAGAAKTVLPSLADLEDKVYEKLHIPRPSSDSSGTPRQLPLDELSGDL